MKAVITAGGRIDGAYAERAGTTIKALAPVRGSTMLARAIAAARGAGSQAIAVLGGDEVRCACGSEVERIVPESEDGGENLRRALFAWPDDEMLLYLTSDLPYVDTPAVADFVARADDGLAIALVEISDFGRRFPGAPPFGIRLAGERVCNGGAFVIPARAAGRVAGIATRFFDARKSPWRMAQLAGTGILLRFAFGALSIAALEKHANSVLGLRVSAVRGCAAELGFDADALAEYEYACEHE